MNTITEVTSFTVVYCPGCGMPFAITEDFEDRRRKDGEIFYCPSGCKQSYGDGENEILKRKLRQANSDKKWWQDHAEMNARSLSATKGQVTKLKKRISQGMCPCCRRNFVNLHDHMARQHPEYANVEPEENAPQT
jgi:hypothetical protein